MKKPNILFILADDLGWRDLSCQGSDFYESPVLDRLAEEGVRFTDAYAACPVCSPTRASALTGRYPARVGVTNYIDWRRQRHPLKGQVIDAPYVYELPKSEYNLAQALGENGYRTWHVGKWHLGDPEFHPEKQGFDMNIGGNQCGMPIHGYFAPWKLPNLRGEDVPEGTYLDDWLTDRAIDLVQRPSDAPFFLNLWYYSVHTPIQAHGEDIRYFREKAESMGLNKENCFEEKDFYPYEERRHQRVPHRMRQSDPVYAAMIYNMDRNIGRVLDALRDTEKLDDTLVVFTSDNGGLSTNGNAPTCNAPLANGKGWVEDGGTRVPLIVRHPRDANAGSVRDTPAITPDLYPTFLELAGMDPLPEQHVDGVSLAPLLRGAHLERGPIFWHYPHYSNCGGHPGCAVRDGDWKLTRLFDTGEKYLFNLREDIGETDNLLEKNPDKLRELAEALNHWLEDAGALFPAPNPDWSEDDHPPGCAPTV